MATAEDYLNSYIGKSKQLPENNDLVYFHMSRKRAIEMMEQYAEEWAYTVLEEYKKRNKKSLDKLKI